MLRTIASLLLCVAPALFGQSAAIPKFEVATVKPSPDDSAASSGIHTGHGRLHAVNVTLKRCIMGAYAVGPNQILGGPDWATSDRFEILAKAEQPIDDDDVFMLMLRDLLADRFQLKLSRETRILRAYVLESGKNGAKLAKADGGESRTNTSSSAAGVTIDARNTTMDGFAWILSRKMDLPVVNHTGLEGVFNFKLQWTPEQLRAADAALADAPSIFTAIQEQLGLRLRAEKTAVQVLVIDSAAKPSEN